MSRRELDLLAFSLYALAYALASVLRDGAVHGVVSSHAQSVPSS